jgi:hypothetical protein
VNITHCHEPAEGGPVCASRRERPRTLELVLALALTIASICLQAVFIFRAGSFWRDEANSILVALKPSLGDVWLSLKFDSFPILHFLVIRGWAKLFGGSDFSLRLLGFTVGLSVLAALWFSFRELGAKTPVIALLLMGTSSVMIRSFDAIRPYGLAALTIILTFTFVWRAIWKPDVARICLATLLSVLCVQTLYQDAFLIFAIGVAALIISYKRGGFRQILIISIPFLSAALSLAFYAGPLQFSRKWALVAQNPFSPNSLYEAFLSAVSSSTPWFPLVWVVVVILAVIGGLGTKGEGTKVETSDCVSLYASVTVLLSMLGYLFFIFFVAGSIDFKDWHLLPFLVVAVITLALLASRVDYGATWRGCFLASVAVIACLIVVPAAQNLAKRMTSISEVASVIGKGATSNDLVVLNPWYLGVSFARYYHGSAPWMMFPGLQETAVHRYDLLKENMEHPEGVAQDLETIALTLRRGGRVWVVGRLASAKPAPGISLLPPAPLPGSGWSSAPYLEDWTQNLTNILVANMHQVQEIPIRTEQAVSPLESPRVFVFQ